MPFTAKYQEYRVDATQFPVDLWSELKTAREKHELVCPDPDCNVQMIPKTYRRTGTQFFAHKAESHCPMSRGMTEEHRALQRHIQKVASDAGWKAQMEVYLPELRHEKKRFVDVLAVSPDDPDCRIAFEIQWSHQTPEAYVERTQSYAERGIRTYWISRKEVSSENDFCHFVLSEDLESVLPGFINNEFYKYDLMSWTVKSLVELILGGYIRWVESCELLEFPHLCIGNKCQTEAVAIREQGNSKSAKALIY